MSAAYLLVLWRWLSSPFTDQILDRLRPSLPAPGTCDLIDVNPGIGLWSKKLHAIVKPRRHILVVPDLKPFSDYLSPLLNARKSKYRHATQLEDVLNPANGFLSEDLHAVDPSLPNALPRTQLNPNLLMTVNLSGPLISHHSYVGSASKIFFNNLWHSLWGQRGDLYRRGMFRTLAWIPHKDKFVLLPRSVALRRKLSITLEATATAQELAAPSRLDRNRVGQDQRWADIDTEDHQRVQESEMAAGITTPSTRQQPLAPPPLLTLNPSPATLSQAAFTSNAKWVPEVLELDSYAKEHDPEGYNTAQNSESTFRLNGDRDKWRFLDGHPKSLVWRKLMTRIRTEHNTRMKAIDLVNQQRLLEREWKDAILAAPSKSLDASSQKDLQERADSLSIRLNKLAKNNKAFAEKAIDDFRAYDQQPRVLSWNNRIAEPLLVHPDEFSHPKHQMAFFDLVPRADLTRRLDTEDRLICFGHLMGLVSIYAATSVYEVCSIMVSGGGVDEFFQTIPGILDPTNGGWYDLKMLRVRSIPVHLLVEIALAFERWPFRPTTQTLLTSKL